MRYLIGLTRNIPVYKKRQLVGKRVVSKVSVEVEADNRVQAGFIAKSQLGRGWRLVPVKTPDTD